MKFITPRPFIDQDTAARKLVEVANAAEAAQDGRIYIERVNARRFWRLAEAVMTSAPASSAPSLLAGCGCTSQGRI